MIGQVPCISMRILFSVNAHEYTAAHRLPLLRAARDRGYRVESLAPRGSPALERLRSEGFRVHGVSLSRRGLRVWEELASLRELQKLYSKLEPDLVHHATIKPVIYGTIAARWAGVPAVVNAVTGLGYVYTGADVRARLLRPVVDRLCRFAFRHQNQRFIFQNADDQATLEQSGSVMPAESALIPGSGVDVERFAPAPEQCGKPLVVLPARMLWQKGVSEFVDAAKQLRTAGNGARFALVGGVDEGNPGGVTEGRLHEWIAEGVVEWWGPVEDMPGVYRAAHVVVLPSYREGLPKVLLEASASARPVVTTDAPGCRDAVIDGETGYLVPAKDSHALAQRIRMLLESPGLRKRMGEAGRRLAVERFSTDRVVEATLRVYDELLARMPSRPTRGKARGADAGTEGPE